MSESASGWEKPVSCAACGVFGPHARVLCLWRSSRLMARTGLWYYEHQMIESVPTSQRLDLR